MHAAWSTQKDCLGGGLICCREIENLTYHWEQGVCRQEKSVAGPCIVYPRLFTGRFDLPVIIIRIALLAPHQEKDNEDHHYKPRQQDR